MLGPLDWVEERPLSEGARAFSDLFEGYDAGVIAGPEIMVTKDRTVTNLAQLLANENIPFGFQSKGTTGVGQLPPAIQYSISKGLGVHDGLQVSEL